MAIHHLVVSALMALSYLQTQLHTSKPELNSTEWLLYKRQFGKSYASEEVDSMRKLIFFANKHKIDKHNAQHEHMKLGLNHLSDQSDAEFKQLLGFKPAMKEMRKFSGGSDFLNEILARDVDVPDELDWRKVPNRVSEVKDQGKCGSCWAFSAVGALEGQEVPRKYAENLTMLSEQNIVDCAETDGCRGGSAALAYKYAKNGIETSRDYPYVGKSGVCQFRKEKAYMNDSGFTDVPEHEETMRQVVAKFGPVSAAMNANDDFMSYKSGVYYNDDCKDGIFHLNHAVVVVGYGHDEKSNMDYWLVKNSWGKSWGDGGYVKMARNRNNNCGIASDTTIPTF